MTVLCFLCLSEFRGLRVLVIRVLELSWKLTPADSWDLRGLSRFLPVTRRELGWCSGALDVQEDRANLRPCRSFHRQKPAPWSDNNYSPFLNECNYKTVSTKIENAEFFPKKSQMSQNVSTVTECLEMSGMSLISKMSKCLKVSKMFLKS